MNRFSELPLKEKASGVLLFLGLLYFIGVVIKSSILDPAELRKHGRFTVVTTTGTYMTAKGGRKVGFEFVVNGEVFSDRWGYQDYLVTENGNYLIKFASTNPNINDGVCNEQVPEQFLIPPPNGWKKMPYDAPCEYPGPLYIDKERLSK